MWGAVQLFLVLGLLALFYSWLKYPRTPVLYPPGPPEDPIIGHLRCLPSKNVEETYFDWSKKYGDIISFRVLRERFVVVNSDEAARDLLQRRSLKFSGRPALPLWNIIGLRYNTGAMTFSKRQIYSRKIVNQYLHKDKLEDYQGTQVTAAQVAMYCLHESPSDYEHIFMRYAISNMMTIICGHRIESDTDPLLETTIRGLHSFNTIPLVGVLDYFPFLRFLPVWKWYYWRVYNDIHAMLDAPYLYAEKSLQDGKTNTSFLARNIQASLDDNVLTTDNVDFLKGAASGLTNGGADTSVTTLSILVLLMVLHPECARKAQEELDRVIGSKRFPTFDDQDRLPYIACIVQETLRWYPIVPSGIPHMATEDDVYNGMFIPRGSVVLANVRGITLDERVYHSPREFRPERFLPAPEGRGEPYPEAVFGYGRRICPGRHLAFNSIWILAAYMLTVFDFLKPLDENGREVSPRVEFTSGIVNCPKHFDFRLKPRSAQAEALIQSLKD